ncbi:MAG TPA: hypothetical protein VLI04_16650 [Nocardioidaceae bacterium]|nr:hypothetical protein [Nocardioidaceae bacterium]
MNFNTNRSTTMMNFLIHEDLARAQMTERLGEARELQRQREILRSRRISRRAERAAQQARLALARSISN